MFLGTSDKHLDIGSKKKKGKYDNYSMKTYIFRDVESQPQDQLGPPVNDFWNIVVLLVLYTIQGEKNFLEFVVLLLC